MKSKKEIILEEETPIYAKLMDYIVKRAPIERENIDLGVITRITSTNYWDDFEINFQDISTKKKYTLKKGILHEKK